MAHLIRSAQRTIFSSSSSSLRKTLTHRLQRHRLISSVKSSNATSTFFFHSRPYATNIITKSPFEANILRILRTEIDYQCQYAPPHQPVTRFNSFTVEDRPGEQLMIMNGKLGDREDIKIEVTMFDGFVSVPKVGVDDDEDSREEPRLHLSLIVDIYKKDGPDALEFVCSAWPDTLEVHKIYVLTPDNKIARPYMGPHFRKLSDKLQTTFREYLEARGVNAELSVFLHEYMMNKDRIELIKWLGKVKSFVET